MTAAIPQMPVPTAIVSGFLMVLNIFASPVIATRANRMVMICLFFIFISFFSGKRHGAHHCDLCPFPGNYSF